MITAAVQEREHYLNASYGIKSWLLTKDHKRIALLYLFTITLFFFLGGAFATLIRLELLTPTGDLVSSETYNKLFTMHGMVMIFFFLIPSIPATLGQFLPADDDRRARPGVSRINLLSWYLLVIGGLFALFAMLAGGVDTGWTFYTPYSTYLLEHLGDRHRAGHLHRRLLLDSHRPELHRHGAPHARAGHDLVPHAAVRLGALRHRADSGAGHAGAGRHPGAGVLRARASTSASSIPPSAAIPVLFQHLFWFYSHPAVYIMILPAMGVISELISTFSRKPIFGYDFIAFSSVAIAVLGFLVWGHHMFVSGQSVYAGMVFSFLSYFVAIPSAIKVFNWTATLYKGSISYATPMLYAFGFIGLFTIGGLTGLFLACAGHRRARHRHLLRGRALPLHHGGRRDHGLPRRPALLVAEDDRPHVSGRLGQAFRAGHLPRLQPDLLPAVHSGLSGHAAPLPRLSAGVPGAARAFHRGRFGAGGGLPDAADLLHLVAALRHRWPAPIRGAPPAWNGRPPRRRRCTISTRLRW